MRWLLLGLLVACASDPDPKEVCGEVGVCPGGTVCDRSAVAPSCLPANEDPDGDGFKNADDLCPTLANTTQYDEDGDRIGDDCDRCPIAPPSDVPDTDGDSVDGICDPEPDMPGNRIVAFSGFREAPANWTLPAGWQVQGGEVVATVPAVSSGILAIPIVSSNHLAIEASYRIDSIATAGGATPAVGTVARDRRPAGTTIESCGVAKVGGIERVQLTTDVESQNATAMGMFDTAALYRVGFLIDGGQTACAVVANATTMKSTSARGGGEQMSEAGLDVSNATARFQWVMVIAR